MVLRMAFRKHIDECRDYIIRVVNLLADEHMRIYLHVYGFWCLVIHCTFEYQAVSYAYRPLRIVTSLCFHLGLICILCMAQIFIYFQFSLTWVFYVIMQDMTMPLITGIKCSHTDAIMVRVQSAIFLAWRRYHVATSAKRGMWFLLVIISDMRD